MKGILGYKIGMTSIFNEKGDFVPVTIIEAGPCKILQKKTKEKDGYDAFQLGFKEVKKKKNIKKPILGFFKKNELEPLKIIREFKTTKENKTEIGTLINVDIFNPGDKVDISGISKGKGFAGVMKRYGFKGASATRGTHESFRGGGAIGQHSYPGKVFKGKKMAGQMGNKRVTTQKLSVIKIDKEKKLLLIGGAVPGANGGLLEIRKSVKG